MSDENAPTSSFAEACTVTTIDTGSLKTTSATFPVADATECGRRGDLAANFAPNAMVISQSSRAPYQDVMGIHLRDPSQAETIGGKGPVQTVIADQRHGQLLSTDPANPKVAPTPIF